MAKSFNATIKARCNKITSDYTKLNNYVHETAMMIVRHAAPEALGGHGDCDMALNLVRAMPASMRRQKLIDWFAKYTPIVVKLATDGDDKVGFNLKYKKMEPDQKLGAWDIDGADADPFFKMAERDPEVKEFDFDALLKMVTRLSGQIEKKIADGEVPEYLTDTAKDIARQISGIKVERPVAANANDGEEKAA